MSVSIPSQQQRDTQLHDWLSQVFANQTFYHKRLAGDASFRAYHRLEVENAGQTQHYIVMDAPPDKESIKEFIAVAKLFKTHGVNAPELVAIQEQQGFLVLEDFGTTDFADKIGKHDLNNSAILYQKAMQMIVLIGKIDAILAQHQAHLPTYDHALLSREMGLFSEWFLPYIDVPLSHDSETLWHNTQLAIINQVVAQPQVVVHRDFHSRNLMILDEGESLGVIDFQDAVIGAYTYDLASLLRDAYIDFDEVWVKEQLTKFYQLAHIEQNYGKTLTAFTTDFNIMSMQRHLKVLGIFIRLSRRDGKDRYLANMPKVMADLIHSAKWLSENTDNADFKAFYTWLNQTVLPKFKEKFNT